MMLQAWIETLRPFYRAVRQAQTRAITRNDGDNFVASSPFLDGWRVVNDGRWPLNWNAHRVDGSHVSPVYGYDSREGTQHERDRVIHTYA